MVIARRWGAAIRAQRTAAGLTVAELARELEVSRPTVYDWESGKTTPHPDRHIDIARALGVHPRLIFTYPDEPVAPRRRGAA